ncbi:MAG TPA: AlkA N-terminal domain-containing protein, partial [Nannocystaceae bacterium]|nr:AlkA N-terminal domain-containing protein [Nannocystaceae bacterium]
MLDADVCYRAINARDARFDGRFFVAVKTTGVYCRPICSARTPKRQNCEFYVHAFEAEQAGYRACFRCRPELAPGAAPIDARPRLVKAAAARISAGALDRGSLDALARELGVTARHLRRTLQQELGISPIELAQSARCALAKQLLQDGALPLGQIAFASGFASVRRFNAAFRARMGCTPSAVRRHRETTAVGEGPVLHLGYRTPFLLAPALAYLRARAIAGSEHVEDDRYLRTVRVGSDRGWIAISDAPSRRALRLELSSSLARAALPIAARVRRMFDLDADPEQIAPLRRDRALAELLRRRPGIRITGGFDGFELAVRAILGQQVTVAAAGTLTSRLAARFAEPIATGIAALVRLPIDPDALARAGASRIAAIGLPRARAEALHNLACAWQRGAIDLDHGADPQRAADALAELPGVGPWTAQYVVMR